MKELVISYDYEEMIQELKEELEDEALTQDDEILVLRSQEALPDGYKPIIDWDYVEDVYSVDVDEQDEYTPEELEMLQNRHKVMERGGEKCKVFEVLSEMLLRNKIIR